MATFLVRDYNDRRGYTVINGPLARTRQLSYVPWALTANNRVVYALMDQARGTPPNGTGLRPYDQAASQERRKLCHTKLGLIALTNLEFSATAVRSVSYGVRRFLHRRELQGNKAFRELFANLVGKYLYGPRYRYSFGRISDNPAPHKQVIWDQSILALDRGRPLETMLNIHDGVGRKLVNQTDPEHARYRQIADTLRAQGQGEIIHAQWRGRRDKDPQTNPTETYAPTRIPGNLPGNVANLPPGFHQLQLRNRGVDMYIRTAPAAPPQNVQVRPETSGNIYYEQLDLRNELFGAGPSGTTGTALAAGCAFGNFDIGTEKMKEYLFAIIGYLVGGGMHSLHESLSILRLAGLEYNTGTLFGYDYSNSPARTDAQGLVRGQVSDELPLLPQKFVTSQAFTDWRDEYYDIVVLGGTHWRFNRP